uniref:Uncharacterized protein n=1 Tax=Rhizophora mucronata TaxID=61149 RepID=A0A2P2N1M5_RHIMU
MKISSQFQFFREHSHSMSILFVSQNNQEITIFPRDFLLLNGYPAWPCGRK